MSEPMASSAKRATASASTLTMLSSHATAWRATSAASTAGRPSDILTSWMAAVAARLAGAAAGTRSAVASVTSARIVVASSPAESGNAIGVDASRPSASARHSVTMSRGTDGAQSAVNSERRCLSRPSTGNASIVSPVAVMRTGRRPWNSPRPRLTRVCPLWPNRAEPAPVCTSIIPILSVPGPCP